MNEDEEPVLCWGDDLTGAEVRDALWAIELPVQCRRLGVRVWRDAFGVFAGAETVELRMEVTT